MTTTDNAPPENIALPPKRNRHAKKPAPAAPEALPVEPPGVDQESIARAYLEKKKRETDEARKKNLEDFQTELSELVNRRKVGIDIEVRERYGSDGNIKLKTAQFLFYEMPKEPGAVE